MSIFSDLLDFIQNRMRMSHIYQPVMLTTLIKGGGTASVTQIASQFAQRDQALIEYYSKITKEACPMWQWCSKSITSSRAASAAAMS